MTPSHLSQRNKNITIRLTTQPLQATRQHYQKHTMKETIETPAAPQPQQGSYSDGGAAFPMPHHHDSTKGCYHQFHAGMTLRDWFAGQALAGMMAHKDSSKWTRNEVAGDCYAYADAMLKAREVLP